MMSYHRVLDWLFEKVFPYLIGGACLVVALSDLLQRHYTEGILFIPLGIVYVLLRGLKRAWQRAGYSRARAEILAALAEADKRGLDHSTFWITQYEKTVGDMVAWR
jgi:hypothetical protein